MKPPPGCCGVSDDDGYTETVDPVAEQLENASSWACRLAGGRSSAR